jgi:hypothetical protein
MNKTERSLLLYVETCAVDYGGRMNAERINTEDREILDRWKKAGFVNYGRIIEADINRNGSLWVQLSEEAWTVAHSERRARAERMWTKRRYTTTAEKHRGFAP